MTETIDDLAVEAAAAPVVDAPAPQAIKVVGKSRGPREPIRSFEGSAKPHEPFWRFVNAAESESKQVELEFYGVISEYSWFEDDITPKLFKEQLYAVGNGAPVLLKIDSPGGDVFAASVIRSTLMDYPGRITARVEGIAASAAVMVTMGAEMVQVMDSAYMMIHDPYVALLFAILFPEDLVKLSKALMSIKDGMLDVYAKRTGLVEDELAQMMADETWMSARQAVNFGFANEVISGGTKQQAKIDNLAFVNSLRNYAHVPPAIMRAYTSLSTHRAAAEHSGNEQELQALRERVQTILRVQPTLKENQ